MDLFLSAENYPAAKSEADKLRLQRLRRKRIARLVVFLLITVALAVGLWLQSQRYFYLATGLTLIGLLLLDSRSDRYFLIRMKQTEALPRRFIDKAVIRAALWRPIASGLHLFFRFAIGWEICMLLLPLYVWLCNGTAYVIEHWFGFLLMQLLVLPPALIVAVVGWIRKRRMLALAEDVEIVCGTVSAAEREEYPERPDELFLVFYDLGKYGIQRMRVNEAQFLCADPGRDAYYLLLTHHRGKYRLRAALPTDKWTVEENDATL